MPVLVAPKVNLPVAGQQSHRSAAELFLPPSPPSSVAAAGSNTDARDEAEAKHRLKGKSESGARAYEGGLDVETRASPVPRLSTTSLASSSSSSMGGGSDLRAQSNTPGENKLALSAYAIYEGFNAILLPFSCKMVFIMYNQGHLHHKICIDAIKILSQFCKKIAWS
jgi:hypothetical protein